MARPGRDPAFEQLLASTQRLASEIRQHHYGLAQQQQQQQNLEQHAWQHPLHVSPHAQGFLGYIHPQQQAPARGHEDANRNGSYELEQFNHGLVNAAAGSMSLDSELAYAGMEDLLLDSAFFEEAKAATTAANDQQSQLARR